jgi:uncharacterized protein (DUF2336 family)
MASHLSQADVERLLKEPSPLVRAEVAGKIALDIDSPQMNDGEIKLAHDIVRLMARDVEVSVRQSLAQNLRTAQRLPHDVAVQLARDVEAVALPILQESTVLTDADLLSIVAEGSDKKHEAIAERPNVSTQVSEALITSAGETAVTKLMNNATAQIAPQSLDKAITRFQASESVKEAMVQRSALPVVVAERLATLVSDRLRDYLVAHHEMSATVAADLVLQSRERTIVGLAAGSSEQEIEKLVQQMFHNGRLTPSIVLRALCMGDVLLFESAVAIMANIPLVNARILIHDGGQLGLKTVYEKANMPASMLPIVRAAIGIVHETELTGASASEIESYRATVIERIVTQFEHFSSEDIDYLITKLGDLLEEAQARPAP